MREWDIMWVPIVAEQKNGGQGGGSQSGPLAMRCSKPPETALRTGCIAANRCCSEALFSSLLFTESCHPLRESRADPATADAFDAFPLPFPSHPHTIRAENAAFARQLVGP